MSPDFIQFEYPTSSLTPSPTVVEDAYRRVISGRLSALKGDADGD
jgi:hypothetical protein